MHTTVGGGGALENNFPLSGSEKQGFAHFAKREVTEGVTGSSSPVRNEAAQGFLLNTFPETHQGTLSNS